jgi:hypothetical protein
LEGCVAVADTGPGRHRWLVSRCTVDLESHGDAVLSAIVRRARHAYGEQLLDNLPEPDSGVAALFDLGALRQAIRAGMLALLHTTAFAPRLLAMLEALGRESLPPLVVCPVIVRGLVVAHLDDLASLRAAQSRFEPAQTRGLCVSVGAPLECFGHRVFSEARKP